MAALRAAGDAGPGAARQALIIGNGDPPSTGLLRGLMASRPLLLCADGGANTAAARGFAPDYVIGDLDSLAADLRAALPPGRLLRVDADDTGTDLQKALRHAVEIGVRRATLTGVTGGRTDHALWNLGLLRLFAADLQLRIVDDHCEIRLVQGTVRFRAARGQRVSLSPFNGPALGVWTRGLRFGLRHEVLAPGIRDGISNEVVGDPVEIGLEAGDLLLVIQRTDGAEVTWLSE